MDIYLTSLALGAVGLAAMAFGGSGRHSGPHGSSHGSPHVTGHGGAHSHGHSHSHSGHAGHAHAGHASPASHTGHSAKETATNSLLALITPRVLFSLALGLGASGLVARPLFSGILLLTVAVGGAILFERLIVTPLWNLLFRFESAPALTLESAVTGEATVVSTFDGNGQGLIAVEVDGQVMQVLGTLNAGSRALVGRVAVGTRVRIDDVDAARNRCTVSLL
jgi:uncharacterized protein YdbL (DUF1318 family)